MSDSYGNRPLIGGEHYYKAVETPKKTTSGGMKNPLAGGVPGGLKIALAVVAGILAVAVIGAGIVMNLKPVKTARAVVKTAKDGGYIVSDIEKGAFISDKCTVSFDGNAKAMGYNVNGNVSFIMSGKTKQVYGSASVPYMGNIEALAEINSKSVKLEAPTLDSHTFVYNYNKDNTGYIADTLGKDGINALNGVLKALYDVTPTSGKDTKALTRITANRLMTLNYVKIDPVKVTVDGKPRKCSGTRVTVTGNDLYSYAVDVMDYVEKAYKDEIEKYNSMAPEYDKFDKEEILKEIGNDCNRMSDIKIDIYTYKGKVAAIEVPDSSNATNYVQILLKGGDYRLQNIEVNEVYNGSKHTVASIKGKRNKTEESLDLYGYNEKYLAHISYDHKSGDFKLSSGSGNSVEQISGNLNCSGKGIILSVDIPSSADIGVSGDITLSYLKEAKLKKFKGNEFDLGSASLGELTSLIDLNSIIELIMDMF